ncbi:MAG: hypothetical protein P4L75_01555, partial [Clostridia bacterium]|nr:hypothetical protein [Clostridia bacterium]
MENNPNEHSLPTPGRRAWPEPVFVAFTLIVSYLFCEFILFGGLGASVALFIAVFYAVALCYLARGGLRLSFGFVVTFSTVA